MQPRTRALAMTAAAALVTCLVALVRYIETHSPDNEPVLYQPRVEQASLADALLPTRSERVVARATSTPRQAGSESLAPAPASAPVLLAPGTLEVLVLDGETPLAGARLTAVGRIEGGIEQGFIEEGARAWLESTGASGLVRWDAVPADQYDVLVRHPDGNELACTLEVPDGAPTTRRVVRFGSAAVRGRVLSDEGEPREDSAVRLQVAPAGGEAELVLHARTDVHGRFAFERLPAGSALAIDAHPDASWLSPGRSVRVELATGDVHELELGPAERGSLVRGRVLAPGGAPATFGVALRWRESERGWHAGLRTGPQGEFEQRLRPGTWSASLTGRDGLVEVAQAEVGRDDATLDIALPPGCLVVRLVAADGTPTDGAIALTDTEGFRTQHPAPSGLAFVAALPPGELEVEGLGFGETATRAKVTIGDSGALAELVLEVE